MSVAVALREIGVRLTGRRRVHGVERFEELAIQRQGIRLDELERVVRLRRDVDTHNLEARTRVPQRGTSSTAEKIKQPRSFDTSTCLS